MTSAPPVRIFASHDWGTKGDNHARVASVVAELRRRNLDVWFDETHMRGNIIDAMCRGIDSADVVLVFLTSNYMKKVESGDDGDNVRREFMYATGTPDKFLCVRFGDLPRRWTGPVSMFLGSQLYVDLVDITPKGIDALTTAIRNRSPRIRWRTAVQRTSLAPPRPATSAPLQGPLRERVRRICEVAGSPEGEMHLCKLVNRLHESLVGTVNLSTPLVERVEAMERHLGL